MRDPANLRSLAANFRKLAEEADDVTSAHLLALADEYEALAKSLEPDAEPPLPAGG